MIEEKNKQEELEIRKPKDKRIKFTKKGIAILTTYTAVLVMVTGGVTQAILNEEPEVNITTSQIVAQTSSNTQLDEVLDKVDSEIVFKLDKLEETVKLSESLHSLNLGQYIRGLEKYEMPQYYNVEDVNNMIMRFCELEETKEVENDLLSYNNREFTKLCLTLESIERKVNGDITNASYKTLVKYAIPMVKTKLLDACGFTADEVTDIKIGSGDAVYVISFTDKETGKIYYIEPVKSSRFHSKGYMHDVIDQIYYWQDCSKLANNNGDTYNGERNNDILEGIKLLKTASLAECELTDDGKLKVNTTMKDIKDKVKKIENIQSNK